MLKTSESTKSTTRLGKDGVEVGDDGNKTLTSMHQNTHQLTQTRLRSSILRLMMAVASRLKIRQKVEESSKIKKPQKPEVAKATNLEEHLPKH